MANFFKKIFFLIKKTVRFLLFDIWKVAENELSNSKKFFIRLLKKIILSGRVFFNGDLSLRASSLTYYTVFAIVPIFALIVAIGRGFGFSDRVNAFITDIFGSKSDILPYILEFVNNYLEHASGGIFVGVGVAFLLWAVISAFRQVENMFNKIWHVKKSRSVFRQFTTYISVLLLVPVLISLASGFSIYINNRMSSALGALYSPFNNFMMQLLPYFFYWLLFTLLYKLIPNTKVKFIHALLAGVVVGSAFLLFQYLYVHGQINLSKYNAVYGTFAAIPLFLMWLQISWLIVLYGAELCFVSQNLKDYYYQYDTDKISRRFRDYVVILITKIIVNRFENELPPVSADEISEKHNIPVRLVHESLSQLIEIKVITEIIDEQTAEKAYQPAFDINKISVCLILDRIEKFGSENFNIGKDMGFQQYLNLVNELKDREITTTKNLLVKDI